MRSPLPGRSRSASGGLKGAPNWSSAAGAASLGAGDAATVEGAWRAAGDPAPVLRRVEEAIAIVDACRRRGRRRRAALSVSCAAAVPFRVATPGDERRPSRHGELGRDLEREQYALSVSTEPGPVRGRPPQAAGCRSGLRRADTSAHRWSAQVQDGWRPARSSTARWMSLESAARARPVGWSAASDVRSRDPGRAVVPRIGFVSAVERAGRRAAALPGASRARAWSRVIRPTA